MAKKSRIGEIIADGRFLGREAESAVSAGQRGEKGEIVDKRGEAVYVCMYVCMYGWMDGWMDARRPSRII